MAGSPASLALHATLQRYGQKVVLKRMTNNNAMPITVDALAKVNPIIPGPVQQPAQGRFRVIMTDEEIVERHWPGPIRKGDTIYFDGRDRNIDSVHTYREGEAVCRIELDVIA